MQRITITVEDGFLAELDALMQARGYTSRSEAIRDLARVGLQQAQKEPGSTGETLAALVYVFEHHKRELSQRLAGAFHDHHDLSLSAMHVHLDHDACLEVTLLRGPATEVRRLADQVIAERGVSYGTLVTVPVAVRAEAHSHGSHRHRHLHTHVRGTGTT
jgi:CopG family nickel-responsive transcriptional regulator